MSEPSKCPECGAKAGHGKVVKFHKKGCSLKKAPEEPKPEVQQPSVYELTWIPRGDPNRKRDEWPRF